MRPTAHAALGALALALVLPTSAAADESVIGGKPAPLSQSPWAVALTSHERFGAQRSGQFCGGVLVGHSTVVTAAHCLSKEVLGIPWKQVRDLKVVVGRDKLSGAGGQELKPAKIWVNPRYDSYTNDGDMAVLTLTKPVPNRPIPIAGRQDSAYRAGSAATVYGWGDTTGGGSYASRLRAAHVNVLPDAVCAKAYPGSADGAYRARTMLCAGEPAGRPGRLPGGQWRAARRARTTGGPGVMGDRLRSARQSRGLYARLGASPGGVRTWCRLSHAGGLQARVGVRVRAVSPVVSGNRPRYGAGPLLARRGCDVSAFLFGRGRRRSGQPLRLVLYFRGDLLEFWLELATVVGAEEQFSAGHQDDAQVCLGAAAVAAVSGRQRARGCQNSSHVASSLARRAVVPGSTSNQAENVPARAFSSKKFSEGAGCCRVAANEPYCLVV